MVGWLVIYSLFYADPEGTTLFDKCLIRSGDSDSKPTDMKGQKTNWLSIQLIIHSFIF